MSIAHVDACDAALQNCSAGDNAIFGRLDMTQLHWIERANLLTVHLFHENMKFYKDSLQMLGVVRKKLDSGTNVRSILSMIMRCIMHPWGWGWGCPVQSGSK